jgi:hypothetical protein
LILKEEAMQDRASSRKIVVVKCPRCGVVFERMFPYGCYDVMPRGGYPRYFCDNCLRYVDGIEVPENRVLLPYAGGAS